MIRLLVAYDGNAGGIAAVHEAARLARASDVAVTVLRVVNPLIDVAGVRAPTREAALTIVIEQVTTELRQMLDAAGLPAAAGSVDSLPHGSDLPEYIAQVVREGEFDMLVVGSKRASGLRGLALGSITQQLLRLGPCPVLVVHPPEQS